MMKKIYCFLFLFFASFAYSGERVIGVIEDVPEGMIETPLSVIRQIAITSGEGDPEEFEVASPVIYKEGTLFMRGDHMKKIEKLKILLSEYLEEMAALQAKNQDIISLYNEIISESTPYFNE